MAVTEIVGPRIKPLWADPVEWTSTRAYEPFTFVTYQGDSYCSRQDTPIGIQITNGDYWVKVSDYNAQAVALQRTMTNTIESAEANMNQSVADVQAVKSEFQTQLDQVTTNKNNITTINNGNKNVILIGDSFTAGSLSDWVPYIHNYNITNYAVNGASLHAKGSGGASFFDQLESAHKTFPDSNDVYMVILYGGVNDQGDGQTSGQAATNLAAWVKKAVSYFPNSKITVCYGNMGRSHATRFVTYNIWLSEVKTKFFNIVPTKLVSFIDPHTWLMVEQGDLDTTDGYFKADNLHPTPKGDYVIASRMQSIMDGTYSEYREVFQIYTGNDVDSHFTSVDGTITYQLQVSSPRIVVQLQDMYVPKIWFSAIFNIDTETEGLEPITENGVAKKLVLSLNLGTAGKQITNLLYGNLVNVNNIPLTSFRGYTAEMYYNHDTISFCMLINSDMYKYFPPYGTRVNWCN